MESSATRREKLREWVQIIASVVTTTAVLVGGSWAYLQFVQGREYAAKMHIHNQATVIRIDENTRLVRTRAVIENIGFRKIDLGRMRVCYRILHPIPSAYMPHVYALAAEGRSANTARLPLPCHRERNLELDMKIEPGESERVLFDFVITDNDVSIIGVEAKIEHPKLEDFNWLDDILVDLGDHI